MRAAGRSPEPTNLIRTRRRRPGPDPPQSPDEASSKKGPPASRPRTLVLAATAFALAAGPLAGCRRQQRPTALRPSRSRRRTCPAPSVRRRPNGQRDHRAERRVRVRVRVRTDRGRHRDHELLGRPARRRGDHRHRLDPDPVAAPRPGLHRPDRRGHRCRRQDGEQNPPLRGLPAVQNPATSPAPATPPQRWTSAAGTSWWPTTSRTPPCTSASARH